jgi:hypothetical protein
VVGGDAEHRGASAWASERRRVRIDSARPQSCDGMMSSRAASSGGFWTDNMKAAAIRYGAAPSAPRVRIAGTKSTVVRSGAAP